ncbi:peptide transporter [Aspergillus sp. HF37]|nr:peptide transporter [Aspergillus sp. HF37]
MAADTSNPMDMAEISKAHAIHNAPAVEKELAVDPAGKEVNVNPAGRDMEKDVALDTSIQELPPQYSADDDAALNKTYPTAEELVQLRRVPGRLHILAFTVAFVELCERFSYYGTTIVWVNFIQRPMPPNSETGAGYGKYVPGALNMGQRASTGLTLFNAFWSYICPLFGAFVADQYLGRFRTIMWSIVIALVGHTVLIISAIPPVIDNPNGSIACFAVGIVIMGMGTGGFKSNISPLISEQYREDRPYIKTLKDGERVIVDPAATIARIYMYFYMMINIGALTGQISMVYAERYVGFYMSFLLPTIMFLISPLVLFACRKRYYRVPPTGSVYTQAYRLWKLAMRGRWSFNPVKLHKGTTSADDFWQRVKPTALGSDKPQWMNFDDAWVDEVARGVKACKVFLWYPLYWLAYNQMINNLTSQAATMDLDGVPNDILTNFNPLALIIFIPIFDRFVYPLIRRMGIRVTPLRRITAGFWLAACSMITAAVTQYYIYKTNPCGKQANYCLDAKNKHSPISVWVQVLTYILGGISEILASITSLEFAYTKAPKNMRSLIQAVALFMNAFSAAIGQAFVGLSSDPLLTWNYTTLDGKEDEMNYLPESEFVGDQRANDEEK